MNFVPADVWRIIFSIILRDDHVFIFKFTKEMIILANYTKSETEEMIKKSIIRNFEIAKVPFFDYCIKNNRDILKSKIFLKHLNVLNSINDKYLCKFNYSYRSSKNSEYSILEYSIRTLNHSMIEWLSNKVKKEDESIENFCYFAVKYNNLKLLQKFINELNYPFDHWCCLQAVKNNNLEILRFLRESEKEAYRWDESYCSEAVKNINLEILQYLRSQNPPCEWRKEKYLYLLDLHSMQRSNPFKFCIWSKRIKELREWIESQPD